MREDLRWPKVLWSMVFAAAIFLLGIATQQPGSKFGIGVYLFLFRPVLLILFPVALLFRWLGYFRRGSFLYILSGVFNLVLGVSGVMTGLKSGVGVHLLLSLQLFGWNIIIGLIIFVDVFIWEFPTRKHKLTENKDSHSF